MSEAIRGFGGTPGPWTLARAGLAGYRHGFERVRPVLVVGDQDWDFAFFYALKVLRGAAFWFPSEAAENPGLLLELGAALNQTARSPTHQSP
jgi:hypothetical protein